MARPDHHRLAAQPADLSATEAVVGALQDLERGFADIEDQVRELAILTRSSETLEAWTLHIYVRYEAAIAELIAPRMPELIAQDPRPRLIGALAMATVRIALDDWLQPRGIPPGPCGSRSGDDRHHLTLARGRAAARLHLRPNDFVADSLQACFAGS